MPQHICRSLKIDGYAIHVRITRQIKIRYRYAFLLIWKARRVLVLSFPSKRLLNQTMLNVPDPLVVLVLLLALVFLCHFLLMTSVSVLTHLAEGLNPL